MIFANIVRGQAEKEAVCTEIRQKKRWKNYAEFRNARPITEAPLGRNLKLNLYEFLVSHNKYIKKKKVWN